MKAYVHVDVAESPAELARGLMYREHLPADSGMLFVFEHPMPTSFWGKNTYIPLDVAFMDEAGRVTEIKKIAPMSTRLVTSSSPCRYALEVNAGFFRRHNIGVGDSAELIRNADGRIIGVMFQ